MKRRRRRRRRPVGRVHIRYRSGHDRWDELQEPLCTDPDLRTISYLKTDGIRIELPIDFLMFWEVAPWDGDKLTRPVVAETPMIRPDSLDWPVDGTY